MKRVIKKRKLKLKVRILLMCILLAFLFVVTLKIFSGNNVKQMTDSIIYNETGDLSYSVCLNENSYISGNCFNDDRSFVTALIKNIDIIFNYNLNSSKLAKYKYTYSVKANLTATEKNDEEKVVYDETTILDSGEENIENSIISLNKKINLDYQTFNNTIISFKKNYILSLDSKLKIIVEINIKGDYSGVDDKINEKHKMEFEIPVADQIAKIEKQETKISNSKTLSKVISKKSKKSLAKDIITKLDILVLIWFFMLLLELFPKQRTYTKKMKKILREYDRAIVKTKRLPDLTNLNIIEIDSFEELLDAKENLNKPILYSESFNKDCADFVILNNKEAYIYSFSAYEEKK